MADSYQMIKNDDEDILMKNWQLHQAKMNRSLNELIQNINNENNDNNYNKNGKALSFKSVKKFNQDLDLTALENENVNDSNNVQLDQNSSTLEFKKYLEDVKKNYLEKLTFSCPSKLNKDSTKIKSDANNLENNPKLKSVENLNNLLNSNAKRSLNYDSSLSRNEAINAAFQTYSSEKDNQKLTSTVDETDLTKTQILSRLVQIREYLKQAYSMLATLQTSNDLINYSSQMNKLHSLIDHLKDQEKSYMDLLNSFNKYKELASNLYTEAINLNKVESRDKVQSDMLNLSELNESINQQDIIHKNQLKHIDSSYFSLEQSKVSSSKLKKRPENENANDSETSSMTGSFISDTLTLNCNNNNNNENSNLNEIISKYRANILNKKNNNFEENELIIIGKGLNKNFANETFEDEKTENDQDVMDFDDEYLTNLLRKEQKPDLIEVKEKRDEIIREINTDIDTLEQLREQKKLLRSIRLRKEELKALEGRRKALEALKKLAADGENDHDKVFDLSVNPADSKKLNKDIDDEDNINKQIDTNVFNQYRDSNASIQDLNTETESKKAVHRSCQTENLNETNSNVKTSIMQFSDNKLILRKTIKQNNKQTSPENNLLTDLIKSNNIQLTDSLRSTHSAIEPSSQIEKSKITAKHYEDLIRKILSEKYSKNLVKAVSSSDLVKFGQQTTEISSNYLNNNCESLESNQLVEEENQELIQSKLESLAENEKKLQELYTMKSKLNDLKTIMNNFNLLKEKVNFKSDEFFDKNEEEKEEDMEPDQADDEIENVELEENKKKLTNAKEKLKELQDLLAKLQSDSSELNLSPNKINEDQQKKSFNALEYLKEHERQKQEEKLEELKKNKHKLLEILKEKEQESAALAKLHSIYTNHSSSQQDENIEHKKNEFISEFSPSKTSKTINLNTSTSDLCLNEIENKFKTAENGFDDLLLENTNLNNFAHSPSDVLWSQMKKQLNMRENLRNKKKELEDIIRDEYNSRPVEKNEDLNENETYTNDENNEIVNGYRDFFLRKKPLLDSEKKAKLLSEFFEQENNKKQENLCSADELIENEFKDEKEEEIVNLFSKYNNQEDLSEHDDEYEDEDDNEDFDKKSQTSNNNLDSKGINDLNVNISAINKLASKIENLFSNQEKINEKMNQNFGDLFEKCSKLTNQNYQQLNQVSPYLMASQSQSQFQTQLQIQQLMFNLNTAYHEISTQRTEITRLSEEMKKVNERLSEIDLNKKNETKTTLTSIGVNTETETLTNKKEERESKSSLAALPSYFYNKKINNEKHETYYTDDFEDLEDEDEKKDENRRNQTKVLSKNLRSESKSSLSTTTSSTVDSKTTSSSSTFALRKTQLSNSDFNNRYLANLKAKFIKNDDVNASNASLYKSFTFDKMREQIYSEVATLISQNESRPFYLLNLFRELQFIKDKNSRDQVLKSIFNISNRKFDLEKSDQNTDTNDDNNDLISYNCRIKRNRNDCSYLKKINKYITTTDSNMDDDDDDNKYLVKKYDSNNQLRKEIEDENEYIQTPFESDSLSNTVIFVKNSPRNNAKKMKQQSKEKGSSSGSSILGVNDNIQDDKQENIGGEVKQLISKIIALIKISNNFDDYDEEDEDNLSMRNLQAAKFDGDYLNEIIDKVLNVLKQSAKHYDYLKLYQNQLSSYLKDALAKYQNKRLIDCMEEILIEISDILYNELTFYSIMNRSRCLAESKKNKESSPKKQSINEDSWSNSKNYSNTSSSNNSSTSSRSTSSSSDISAKYNTNSELNIVNSDSNLVDETEAKFNKCKNQSIELLKRLSSILNDKFGDIKHESEDCLLDRLMTEEKNKLSYLTSDLKQEFDNINKINDFLQNEREMRTNKFDMKSLKYLNTKAEIESSCCGDETEVENVNNNENDEESNDENIKKFNKIEISSQLPYKVIDINDLKVDENVKKNQENDSEITVEDLKNEPEKLNLTNFNQDKDTVLECLDKIIMDSIEDNLAGDPDGLSDLSSKKVYKNEEESHSLKSESSNSDNFVIISGGSSDHEVIDLKNEDPSKPAEEMKTENEIPTATNESTKEE